MKHAIFFYLVWMELETFVKKVSAMWFAFVYIPSNNLRTELFIFKLLNSLSVFIHEIKANKQTDTTSSAEVSQSELFFGGGGVT